MAECAKCGAEADLYVADVPFCIACDDKAVKHEPFTARRPTEDELSRIDRELTEAREAYEQAKVFVPVI